MNKSLLIIAGVLTAFVLVVMGGVFANVLDTSKLGASKLSNQVYRVLGIKSEEQMQTSLLVNPNADNVNANERQSNTTDTNNAPSPVVLAANTPTVSANAQWMPTTVKDNGVMISTEQARNIAQRAAPNTPFGAPELVRYSGKVAYEVVSPQGNVYVDANTGAVLDNGAAAEAQTRAYGDDDDEEKEHRGKKRKHHKEEDEDEDDDDDEYENRRG